MKTILANLTRLILLILLLPVFIIVIGPLFVLAALRGHQPVGPIILNTARYGFMGRVGSFILGLIIWALVWGGLGWIVINGLLLPPTVAVSTAVPSLIFTPSPTLTLSPTASPSVPIVATPTATATPTHTATSTPTQPTSTQSPTPNKIPTVTLTPASAIPTLTFTNRQAVIAAVAEGNLLLREVASLNDKERIQNLKRLWRERAFIQAQAFIREFSSKYTEPVVIHFEYVTLPAIQGYNKINEVTVSSQEVWSYKTATTVDRETLDFSYTLTKINSGWVITKYSYFKLSSSP